MDASLFSPPFWLAPQHRRVGYQPEQTGLIYPATVPPLTTTQAMDTAIAPYAPPYTPDYYTANPTVSASGNIATANPATPADSFTSAVLPVPVPFYRQPLAWGIGGLATLGGLTWLGYANRETLKKQFNWGSPEEKLTQAKADFTALTAELVQASADKKPAVAKQVLDVLQRNDQALWKDHFNWDNTALTEAEKKAKASVFKNLFSPFEGVLATLKDDENHAFAKVVHDALVDAKAITKGKKTDTPKPQPTGGRWDFLKKINVGLPKVSAPNWLKKPKKAVVKVASATIFGLSTLGTGLPQKAWTGAGDFSNNIGLTSVASQAGSGLGNALGTSWSFANEKALQKKEFWSGLLALLSLGVFVDKSRNAVASRFQRATRI